MVSPGPRVLVVGATGQVGSSLLTGLPPRWTVLGTHRTRPGPGTVAAPTDRDGWHRLLGELEVRAVVVAAALTDVDRCQARPELSLRDNVVLVSDVVAAAAGHGAHVVHLSTDYVFDGEAGPYTEAAPTAPVNVYGGHKRDSEVLVTDAGGAVLRTSVVYGAGRSGAVDLMAHRLRTTPTAFSAVQRNSPTHVADLVELTGRVLAAGYRGLLHAAGPRTVSRHTLAVAVARAAGLPADHVLVAAPDRPADPGRARRPVRCGLVVDRAAALFDYRPVPIEEGLTRHFR